MDLKEIVWVKEEILIWFILSSEKFSLTYKSVCDFPSCFMRTERCDMTSGQVFVTSTPHNQGRPTKLNALSQDIAYKNGET